jgi:lantibiotic biosynthesis protein
LHVSLGNEAVATAWWDRAEALAAYRLAGEAGNDTDAILTALLHSHAVRALGPDGDQERASLRLARAAALAYLHVQG